MGIIRGICNSCNRTTVLTDKVNLWCQKCIDPDYRKRCDRKYLIGLSIAGVAVFIYVVLMLWVLTHMPW
jgi:hypothetical protein